MWCRQCVPDARLRLAVRRARCAGVLGHVRACLAALPVGLTLRGAREGGQAFLRPAYPWEFVQIGNCGSPIELDEGWLLLTHGVGPVRKYSIGAVLLDKRDPAKVLARTREPLVRPEPTEREGYVPNVVYTCGAIRHGDRIILPYAISDTFSNFATIKIAALLEALAA